MVRKHIFYISKVSEYTVISNPWASIWSETIFYLENMVSDHT